MQRKSLTFTSESYEVKPGVVLVKGSGFKAKNGPYYKQTDYTTHEKWAKGMGEKGPFVFLRHVVKEDREWIEALNKEGCFCTLALKQYPALVPSITNRPYTIIGAAPIRQRTGTKAKAQPLQTPLSAPRARLRAPKTARAILKPTPSRRAQLRPSGIATRAQLKKTLVPRKTLRISE